jgi:hypothetical protein
VLLLTVAGCAGALAIHALGAEHLPPALPRGPGSSTDAAPNYLVRHLPLPTSDGAVPRGRPMALREVGSAVWPSCEVARALAFATQGLSFPHPPPSPCGGTPPVPAPVRPLAASRLAEPGTTHAPKTHVLRLCGAHRDELLRMGAILRPPTPKVLRAPPVPAPSEGPAGGW